MQPTSFSDCPPASLLKQFLAIVYDSFLILAILFVATAAALALNNGEPTYQSPIFKFYLIMIIFTFYAWFWKKSGQTLGMRAWKIRILSESGNNPDWMVSYARLCLAVLSFLCFGLGYFWCLFTSYTWHDKLTYTRIIDVSKLPK